VPLTVPRPCALPRRSAHGRPPWPARLIHRVAWERTLWRAAQPLRASPHARSCTRRVYRGKMRAGEDPGLFLIADGGDAWADVLAAYGMDSIWEAREDRPAKAHEPAEA